LTAKTAIDPTMRILIVLLAVAAGILACAIYVAANSPGYIRAEAALAAARSQAEEAGNEAAERIEKLERENAALRKQLELATANLDRQSEKLAVAEQQALRLRSDLDAALKQLAELSQKYAAAQIKKAEDLTAEARDAQRKAKLDADAVKRDPAMADVKAPAAGGDAVHAGNKKRNRKNGNPRGPVASLPRTCPSFSELDTDHDGRLTLEEYKAGFPDAVDVEKEFKALDTNGDGTLSIDEYKAGHPDPPVVRIKKPKKN
jgi:hypothetical protein